MSLEYFIFHEIKKSQMHSGGFGVYAYIQHTIYGQKGINFCENILLLRKSLISSDLAILSTESPEKDPRFISAPHDNKSRASSILSFSTASCSGLKFKKKTMIKK